MKVFYSVDFKGHWPVGTAALVIAKDAARARRLMGDELYRQGLPIDPFSLKELDTSSPSVIILNDGDY